MKEMAQWLSLASEGMKREGRKVDCLDLWFLLPPVGTSFLIPVPTS